MFHYDIVNVQSYHKDMMNISNHLDSENFFEDTLFKDVYRNGSYFYDKEMSENHFKNRPYSKMMIEDPRYLDFVNYHRLKNYYKNLK